MHVLGMFARYPEPGRVKTRLAERLGAHAAADIYRAFLGDLARRLRHCADRRVLCYTPADALARQYFAALGAGDFELWSQPDGELGQRMFAFFTEYLQAEARVVLIGSDAPTLPRETLKQAFSALDQVDCVLGPATDGGYYLLGLRVVRSELFSGIAWSTAGVLAQTVERIRAAGLTLRLLQPWYDVDTWNDLRFLDGHRRSVEHQGGDGQIWAIDQWLDKWNLASSSRLETETPLPYEDSTGN